MQIEKQSPSSSFPASIDDDTYNRITMYKHHIESQIQCLEMTRTKMEQLDRENQQLQRDNEHRAQQHQTDVLIAVTKAHASAAQGLGVQGLSLAVALMVVLIIIKALK